MAKLDVVHILNTHFPTKWSNENLRERVIEFGEDIRKQSQDAGYRAAIDSQAKILPEYVWDVRVGKVKMSPWKDLFCEAVAAEIRKLGQ